MIKHKSIKLFWLIVIPFLIILKLVSITRADKDFISNATTKSDNSFHSQHLKVRPSEFDHQSFINERYTLNKTTIHDTVIRLENTSVLLSNTNVTGSKILSSGMMGYSVFITHCVFKRSIIVIDSASKVTIMYTHNLDQEFLV